MAGERNLEKILAELAVDRRPGRFVFVSVERLPEPLPDLEAVVREEEGVTLVLPAEEAERNGWEPALEVAWLTLRVHSALDGVGLTAAVATALAGQGIACNVVAGVFHDHLLVPIEHAERAVAVLERLRGDSGCNMFPD